jgi:hypothetical protein
MTQQYTPNLGQLCADDARRDAIHIAVAPVVANETLNAGDHVGLTERGFGTLSEPWVGIVDPFLAAPVERGQRFWLFLYPNTITGLRHVWSHPAFKPTPPPPERLVAMTPPQIVRAKHPAAVAVRQNNGMFYIRDGGETKMDGGQRLSGSFHYESQAWEDAARRVLREANP